MTVSRIDAATRERVRGLEGRIAALLSGRDRTTLAFSAGLGSTLVAAIARKRCDLTCLVVGTADAPDVRAAERARSFLDFAVTRVPLDGKEAARVARRLAAAAPDLRPTEVIALLPAFVVRDRDSRDFVLTGFGIRPSSRAFREALPDLGLSAPIGEALQPSGRKDLARCGALLGLPAAFASPVPRSPPAGMGLSAAERVIITKTIRGPHPDSTRYLK